MLRGSDGSWFDGSTHCSGDFGWMSLTLSRTYTSFLFRGHNPTSVGYFSHIDRPGFPHRKGTPPDVEKNKLRYVVFLLIK